MPMIWIAFHRPDGWQYPHNSTLLASNLITSLDPYHPISLVLNCFDYFFEAYTQGVTVVLQVSQLPASLQSLHAEHFSCRTPTQSILTPPSAEYGEHLVTQRSEIVGATTAPDRSPTWLRVLICSMTGYLVTAGRE